MSKISEKVAAVTDDIESEKVFIPSWDVDVEVRGMDGHGRAAYLQRLIAAREEEDTEALTQVEMEVLIACVCDPETHEPAFEESDIPMLMNRSGGIIGMLSMKALKASGLDKDAETRLGKPSSDSKATVSDASTFTSPES